MESGSLFNQGYLGQGFNWWIGQIPDDSTWRDNIIPGKFDNKEQVTGWGRRYKVRIIGLHDQGEESLPSDQLPWAQVMYPITAGGGQGEVYQTPGIRQGNFVFGFFMDGPEGQVPVIMGILGNNTQTALKMATSLKDEGDGKAKNFSAISGFSPTSIPKAETKEFAPEESLTAKKPIDKEVAKEEVNISRIGKPGFQPTIAQQSDINSANASLDKLASVWRSQGKSGEEIENLSSKYLTSIVKQGTKNRSKEANSPETPIKGNPTKENSDNPHLLSAGDVKREDKYKEKIVLMKPDDIVSSSIKATQTAMDNLSVLADKMLKAQQDYGYIEAVSGAPDMQQFKKKMEDASREIAKYMKVPFNKMMEYTNKTVNKELVAKVSALPSCMRFQFADMKDITGETTLQEYGNITNNLSGQIESIMDSMFDVQNIINRIKAQRKGKIINPRDNLETVVSVSDDPIEARIIAAYVEHTERAPMKGELISKMEEIETAGRASDDVLDKVVEDIKSIGSDPSGYNYMNTGSWQDNIELTVPRVPICTAEDLMGRVMYANKDAIDKVNDSTITYLNAFLDDMRRQIGGSLPDPNSRPRPRQPEGAIISFNDEEVLNQVRGGSGYTSGNNLSTYWYTNINPGITTSPGRGATVNVGVSTGGLGSSVGGSIGYSWVDQGTGYTNQNAVSCTIVGSGTGSGMKVNLVTAGGEITNIFTHTAGTNYKPNTLLRIDHGNFDAQFILNQVYGSIDPGEITLVDGGSKYQTGDVIGIVGGNDDATFTITGTNEAGNGKANGGKPQSLSDILGLLGDIGGNISAALDFENMKTNIFPFELPANPAVSDLYQFTRGGSGAEEPQMPSFGAVGKFVDKMGEIEEITPDKIKEFIPDPPAALPFVQPSMGEPDLNFLNPPVSSEKTIEDILKELQEDE